MIAVVLYHAGLSWLPGGFLGVDVFFVISGYLITALLLAEHQQSGTISVRRFYVRRARRLLPALGALLVGVTAMAALFFRDDLAQLRAQVLAALTYCTNWYLIATDGSYFQRLGQPLILRHLWSLAVEEQFYLLWPIALLVLLRWARGRLGPVAIAIAGATLASALWMAVLFHPGTDPSRVYYGTDTRVFTLLIGALLALFWRPHALERGRARRHGPLFDLLGLLALAGLLTFFLSAHETSAALYRGGFLILALVAALAVAAATHPAASFGRALMGNRALVWIGLRSYAIYLWHWPIVVVTRPHVDVPLGTVPDLILRLGLTVLLADLSYRLIERPIRQGGLRRWLRQVLRTDRPHPGRRPLGATIVAAATGGLTLLVAVLATSGRSENEIAQSLRAGEQAIAAATTGGSALTAPPDVPTLTTLAPAGRTLQPDPTEAERRLIASTGRRSGTITTTTTIAAVAATARALTEGRLVGASASAGPTTATTVATTAATTTASAPQLATAAPPVGPIVGFGDSVMLGAAPQLLQTFGPGTVVDAKVGRTLWPIIGIARLMQAQGRLGERVLIHLGDNGGLNPDLIAKTMASLQTVDRVVWVTVKVPRAWEATVNHTLATELPKYPNARLLDWHALATDPTMLYSDGIHLRPSGARFYATLVERAFAAP